MPWMSPLQDFLERHTAVDAPELDAAEADLVFFRIKARDNPDGNQLRALLKAHADRGPFATVDVLDGQEHSYLELGAWLGSQGTALRLMGLGQLLGLWQLLTPKNMLGPAAPDDLVKELAGAGYVTVVARPAVEARA